MKIFGSISRLTSIIFRKNSRDITLRPNQATTYTAARDSQLPPGDADSVLVSENGSQALTNKTLDAASNTISNIADSNISATAGIVYSKLSLSGSIVDGDISNSAAIVDTKLDTISTAGKVSNSATTATNSNTPDAIVARDGSGDFSAGTITADLIGNVTGDVSGTAGNITATSNDTLTTLSALSLPGSQVSGDISGNAANVTGVVALANGGTGQTTALLALNALLPSQTGNSGKVLSTDGAGNVTWISNVATNSYSTDWVTGDGTTKAVTHNLGTLNVLVQVFDKTDGSEILIDSLLRDSTTTLSLTSSQAPGAAGWKVLILAI